MPSFSLVAAAALLAYLIGGLPFGYWFVRLSSGRDIRTMGSGNIGATNVHRAAGGKAGLIVLLLDICKGFAAVVLAAYLTHNDPVGVGLSVIAVLLGHCYPVFLRFKGGKAVACFIGAFLYLAPLALLAVVLVFLGAFAFGRHVSLGSIVGAAAFPFALWLLYTPSPPILLAAIASAVLIIYRHKANIERLLRGEEHVFSLKGGKAVKNP
ncbi:MAG: glycerol-3-phosphate 1-O-acyltransferase PlsY [Acidobacteriaceae bacterium]|nr:glycerol-3-phosphate 1-O-acyltransferase PlsY [Acidobacteriaceae bacterium]